MSGFEEFVFFGGPCVRMGGVALCRSGLEEPLVFFADFGSAWAVLRFAGAAWKSRLFFLRTLGPHGRCCACRSGLEERFFFFFFCGLWVRMGGVAPAEAAWKSRFFFCGLWVRMGGVAPAEAAWKSRFFLYADLASAWVLVVAAMLKRCFRPLERPS